MNLRYTVRIAVALLAFLFGTTAFLCWSMLRVPHQHFTSAEESNSIPPINFEGKVYFRFLECAGNRSVFILDNQTDHPIYAQVQRVDYWKEYKDADIELGVHHIEDVASTAVNPEEARTAWDAPPPFKMIAPYSSVRYGVDFGKGKSKYKVKVPYMEDGEVVRRLNENFPSMLKHDFERVKASWKIVSSDVVTNRCH